MLLLGPLDPDPACVPAAKEQQGSKQASGKQGCRGAPCDVGNYSLYVLQLPRNANPSGRKGKKTQKGPDQEQSRDGGCVGMTTQLGETVYLHTKKRPSLFCPSPGFR